MGCDCFVILLANTGIKKKTSVQSMGNIFTPNNNIIIISS